MDERTKESISALMDDEANELEIQRLLSRADSQELLDTWQGYHRVRDVMSGMRDSRLDIDISKRVAASIDIADEDVSSSSAAERADDLVHRGAQSVSGLDSEKSVAPVREGSDRKAWLKYGGGAIAACLMVVLATSFQLDNEPTVVERSGTDEYQLVVNRVDPDQVSRVNEYLLRHAERSSVSLASTMTPLVRVASVNSIGI